MRRGPDLSMAPAHAPREAPQNHVAVTIHVHPKAAETLDRMARALGNVGREGVAQRLFEAAFAVRCGVVADAALSQAVDGALGRAGALPKPSPSPGPASPADLSPPERGEGAAGVNCKRSRTSAPAKKQAHSPRRGTGGAARPHCDKPEACEAKGPAHCRRCHGRTVQAMRHQTKQRRGGQA